MNQEKEKRCTRQNVFKDCHFDENLIHKNKCKHQKSIDSNFTKTYLKRGLIRAPKETRLLECDCYSCISLSTTETSGEVDFDEIYCNTCKRKLPDAFKIISDALNIINIYKHRIKETKISENESKDGKTFYYGNIEKVSNMLVEVTRKSGETPKEAKEDEQSNDESDEDSITYTEDIHLTDNDVENLKRVASKHSRILDFLARIKYENCFQIDKCHTIPLKIVLFERALDRSDNINSFKDNDILKTFVENETFEHLIPFIGGKDFLLLHELMNQMKDKSKLLDSTRTDTIETYIRRLEKSLDLKWNKDEYMLFLDILNYVDVNFWTWLIYEVEEKDEEIKEVYTYDYDEDEILEEYEKQEVVEEEEIEEEEEEEEDEEVGEEEAGQELEEEKTSQMDIKENEIEQEEKILEIKEVDEVEEKSVKKDEVEDILEIKEESKKSSGIKSVVHLTTEHSEEHKEELLTTKEEKEEIITVEEKREELLTTKEEKEEIITVEEKREELLSTKEEKEEISTIEETEKILRPQEEKKEIFSTKEGSEEILTIEEGLEEEKKEILKAKEGFEEILTTTEEELIGEGLEEILTTTEEELIGEEGLEEIITTEKEIEEMSTTKEENEEMFTSKEQNEEILIVEEGIEEIITTKEESEEIFTINVENEEALTTKEETEERLETGHEQTLTIKEENDERSDLKKKQKTLQKEDKDKSEIIGDMKKLDIKENDKQDGQNVSEVEFQEDKLDEKEEVEQNVEAIQTDEDKEFNEKNEDTNEEFKPEIKDQVEKLKVKQKPEEISEINEENIEEPQQDLTLKQHKRPDTLRKRKKKAAVQQFLRKIEEGWKSFEQNKEVQESLTEVLSGSKLKSKLEVKGLKQDEDDFLEHIIELCDSDMLPLMKQGMWNEDESKVIKELLKDATKYFNEPLHTTDKIFILYNYFVSQDSIALKESNDLYLRHKSTELTSSSSNDLVDKGHIGLDDDTKIVNVVSDLLDEEISIHQSEIDTFNIKHEVSKPIRILKKLMKEKLHLQHNVRKYINQLKSWLNQYNEVYSYSGLQNWYFLEELPSEPKFVTWILRTSEISDRENESLSLNSLAQKPSYLRPVEVSEFTKMLMFSSESNCLKWNKKTIEQPNKNKLQITSHKEEAISKDLLTAKYTNADYCQTFTQSILTSSTSTIKLSSAIREYKQCCVILSNSKERRKSTICKDIVKDSCYELPDTLVNSCDTSLVKSMNGASDLDSILDS